MEMLDRQCVERAQQGDLLAFSEVVTRYRRIAYSAAYARLGNADDAHDAVQDAFIDAYLSLPQLKDARKFHAWLITILTRRCARVLAARRQQARIHAEALAECLTDSISLGDRDRPTVIDRLPVSDRDLLTLSVLDGYAYAEIATQMQLPVTTVRSRIHRARLRLYKEVYPMSDAATIHLSCEVLERVLLRLTSIEQPFTSSGLKQATERGSDGEIAAITNGLAWLLEHGESLERAFLLTGALPPGLCDLIRLGRETGRSEMMFHTAASLLKVGLLQQKSLVTSEEAATFFAYFSCMLQAGVPVVQAMKQAGQHVPPLANVATDITEAWLSHQSMAVILDRHGMIFTEPMISLLLLGESTGQLDSIAALLAALLWEPDMLKHNYNSRTWAERLHRAEEIMRAQGRFKE